MLDELPACQRCVLRSGCDQVVVGKGAAAGVMFIGEHPGREEDLLGEPYVSREGLFLRRLINQAGFQEKDYYLTLAVKCLPRNKNEPEDTHISSCKIWLWRELQFIKPKVVITLGKIPTRLLLGLKKSFRMQDEVGQFKSVSFMGALVAPWYSPSHVLQHGKKGDKDFVQFLSSVKEKFLEKVPANVS